MFADSLRDDAKAVYDLMRVPAVMRVRSEESVDSHPLLAMRLARMGTNRVVLKGYASSLIESSPPLEGLVQKRRVAEDVRRCIASCVRVLECTDDPSITTHVGETLRAMSGSISVMATIVGGREDQAIAEGAAPKPGPTFSDQLRQKSVEALYISTNLDTIAAQIKSDYDRIRIEIAEVGERTEPLPEPVAAAR